MDSSEMAHDMNHDNKKEMPIKNPNEKIINNENSFFEKNTQTWGKLINKQFESKFTGLIESFDFRNPENNASELIEISNALKKLPNSDFKKVSPVKSPNSYP